MSLDARPDPVPPAAEVPDSHDAAAKPMALLLWLAVLGALTYGVLQTLAKVVALFS